MKIKPATSSAAAVSKDLIIINAFHGVDSGLLSGAFLRMPIGCSQVNLKISIIPQN
ncbi:MAG: hypothetical protein JO015_02785 [Verrucomicrobia bacterium]|nr:hypothetical protein [Verrucomicrobiota bacterium]